MSGPLIQGGLEMGELVRDEPHYGSLFFKDEMREKDDSIRRGEMRPCSTALRRVS